jgi:hypothetical protein
LAQQAQVFGAVTVARRELPPQAAAIECQVTFAGANSARRAGLLASLQSVAMMRRAMGHRMDTLRMVETFEAESRASGWHSAAIDGPWRVAWLLSSDNGDGMLIAEDDGVVLLLNAQGIDPNLLPSLASSLAERLR